ncbi:MAG: pyridoxamine 5'-phosphate oxidase family protein [Deltaproteobacteria bacterium]|nr:pyridoxamine 5'-phosphate oxidase family protein [Deltaproteobacteria bacterium]
MNPDEPLFDKEDDTNLGRDSEPAIGERIYELLSQQPYGVLCVQGGGQPYGALVAFAFSEDLRHLSFVTPVTTRKYRLLNDCDQVAFVVDSRSTAADGVMEVEAVTATGRSLLIDDEGEFEHWAELLVRRHPYLKSFVKATTCALFRVDIVRFLHVMRFQEVRQWIPNGPS